MNTLDDFPQRGGTHDTADAAAFRSAVESCKLFVVQRADRADYGTDVQLEARSGEPDIGPCSFPLPFCHDWSEDSVLQVGVGYAAQAPAIRQAT